MDVIAPFKYITARHGHNGGSVKNMFKTLYGIIFVLIWAVVGYIREHCN